MLGELTFRNFFDVSIYLRTNRGDTLNLCLPYVNSRLSGDWKANDPAPKPPVPTAQPASTAYGTSRCEALLTSIMAKSQYNTCRGRLWLSFHNAC